MMKRRRMRLERRHPCLHECEARKGSYVLEMLQFDAAERRGVAGRDACAPVRVTTGHRTVKNYPAMCRCFR